MNNSQARKLYQEKKPINAKKKLKKKNNDNAQPLTVSVIKYIVRYGGLAKKKKGMTQKTDT